MMINITRGQINNSILSNRLVSFFEANKNIDGNLFLGYPILPTMDNKIAIDALLISKKYGVIAFMFYDGVKEVNFEDAQDEQFAPGRAQRDAQGLRLRLLHGEQLLFNIDQFTVCNSMASSSPHCAEESILATLRYPARVLSVFPVSTHYSTAHTYCH